jgi:hypothetical protein
MAYPNKTEDLERKSPSINHACSNVEKSKPRELHARILNEGFVKVELMPHPTPLELNRLATEFDKSLAYIPYWLKPKNCPTNDAITGKKNRNCLQISGSKCNEECSIKKLVKTLEKYGIKKEQLFVIDGDASLLDWLKGKTEQDCNHLNPGIRSRYAVSYALDFVGKTMGYDGLILVLEGHSTKSMGRLFGYEIPCNGNM